MRSGQLQLLLGKGPSRVIPAAVAECHALHAQQLYLGSEVNFQFQVSSSMF